MIRFTTLIIALAASTPALADTAPRRELRISLSDAVALSLKNNPDIAVAGFAPRIAAAEVKRQRGIFDPTFTLFAGLDRDRIPGSTPLGTFRNSATAKASLSGRLPAGTEYELSYGTTRVESDTKLSPIDPASSAYVELSVRQPLLRGFGTNINRAPITIARGNERIADLGFRRQTELALTATVDAYWRLVRAHKSLAVARESLQLAQQLVQRTDARVSAGDLPTIELTQARASVAAREEAVILGEAEVGNANDGLARLLVVDARAAFAVTFVPTDDAHAELATMQSSTILDEAFRHRAELAAARQAVKNAEVGLEAARNARRPDLSAVGSVGIGGLDSKWATAQSELARDVDDQHRWTVGLVFSVPLGNRSADGAYEKARLALDEAKLALRSIELQVSEEVRSAVRNLDASTKRIESTRRASQLAREQLGAGEKRLATGMATAFEIVRLQTDLAAAQNAEIAAMIGYRTSSVRVQLATGALFGNYVDAAFTISARGAR
jgi:outer membrane protein